MKASYISLKEFGAAFLAPVLSTYVRSVEINANGSLPVCLAREGWLLYHLLNRLIKEKLIHLDNDPIYLKVSRTVLFRATLGDPLMKKIALKGAFKGNVMSLMMKRFGLQLHEVYSCLPAELLDFNLTLPDDIDNVLKWLEPHNTALERLVSSTRNSTEKYFEQCGLNDPKKKILLLDVGYAGTIQKLMTQLLQRSTDGLYFVTTSKGEVEVDGHKAKISGMIREGVDWKQGYTMLDRSLFLECLMTAPHGQVVDIQSTTDNKFIFLYGREASTQKYYQDLEAVLEGAVNGVIEAIRNEVVYSIDEIENLYEVYTKHPGALPRSVWHLFTADDDITGNGMINPLNLFGMSS